MKAVLFFVAFGAALRCAAEAPICRPFQAYPEAPLPVAPTFIDAPTILPQRWEENLVSSISQVKTQERFAEVYQNWKKENFETLSDHERYLWLRCIEYYVSIDSNGDGKPDWTAIIDDRPSRVLYPTKSLELKLGDRSQIPLELKFVGVERKEATTLQDRLFKDFNVLAIDNSDKHSPEVLKDLIQLYRYGFPYGIAERLKSVRYIYAFSGHDPKKNSAAYHQVAHAISVGGERAFKNPLSLEERVHVLGALAHEMGHAFVFDNLSPAELMQIAKRFGGWSKAAQKTTPSSFYDHVFFLPRILNKAPLIRTQNGEAQTQIDFKFYQISNITSQYSTTNIHEWFAEAFAATALIRLGEAHFFGDHWKDLLVKVPQHSTQFWSNYNNVSPAFIEWLNAKIKSGNHS